MKKNLLTLFAFFLISSIFLEASELKYYESLGGFQFNGTSKLKVYDNDIYLFSSGGLHKITENNFELIFDLEEINSKRKNQFSNIQRIEILQKDLISVGFHSTIFENSIYSNINTEVVIKDGENWFAFDSANTGFLKGGIYDFALGPEREVMVISSTDKIGYYKSGNLEYYDCNIDYDCMPQPFMSDIAAYHEGCYYYYNVNYDIKSICNRELSETFKSEDFNISELYTQYMWNFSVDNQELWMCNTFTNSLHSIKEGVINNYYPLSEEVNIKHRLIPESPLYIFKYLWGHDGNLYLIYKQSTEENTLGSNSFGVVFKMDKNFNLLEVLDIPQIISESPPILELSKDVSDPNNKKVYISTGLGLYIYDPTATSVDEKNAEGPVTIFVSQVYPNPANTFINVRYGADISNYKNIEVYVTNILGQRIKTFEDAGHYSDANSYGSAVYDISDLPNGQYLLVLTDGNNFATESIIIQR